MSTNRDSVFLLEQHCLCYNRKDRSQLQIQSYASGSSAWNGWLSRTHDTHLCLLLLRPLSPDFSHSFPVSDLDECLLCFRLRRRGSCCLALLIGHVVISDPVGWQFPKSQTAVLNRRRTCDTPTHQHWKTVHAEAELDMNSWLFRNSVIGWF